ncbi:DUF1614 domain-containing protein [Methylomonas rivi]|uniref:DUF1614 domain-containing protein n=1 Tax=Methylomonas rivi TaxID=2952226 RepID=A0ABT1U4J1_9GAMM|nr:DUF1614 domain-containing protein [Methylomonas sp. WSC-6]MBS4052541.1 DUF1614 domain-containing protein [Methylomonas sp.]MCQ8128031.1 DUF1614 domain-containing protein [Methylomonas sp. WSC-6]
MPAISLMLFFLMSVFLVAMIQVQFFQIAFAKLGLTPEATLAVLIGTLLGSGINLPIFKLKIQHTGHLVALPGRKPIWELFQPVREGCTVIAINVGGCVIPVGLCVYFISLQLIEPLLLGVDILIIAGLSYRLSRPVPGLGIAMPLFIAPLASALLALILDPAHAAHLAYIGGVLGVLIGADILHLKSVGSLGVPVASIGGAGTFDGIFLTGIIAALLA